MKRMLIWLAATGLVLTAAPAHALRYLSLEQAIHQFLPAGAQVTQVTRTLTPEQKTRLERDYGWKPDHDQVTFYTGQDASGHVVAYILIQDEIFNTCFHKFAIGLTPTGEVIDVAIVELSCPRAVPIDRKDFLNQFKGKKHTEPLTTRADIDAVTGATLSSEVAAIATRKALGLQHLLFGGGAPIQVPEKVRKARKAGQEQIQRAIQTAPWAQPGQDPDDHR